MDEISLSCRRPWSPQAPLPGFSHLSVILEPAALLTARAETRELAIMCRFIMMHHLIVLNISRAVDDIKVL